MKKAFGARRVPRKIGSDDNEELTFSAPGVGQVALDNHDQPSSVIKRPSNKTRKSSAARTSFDFCQLGSDQDNDASNLVTPKRKPLAHVAIQRNAEKHTPGDSPFRFGRDEPDERPSYSRDHLEELKNSTPSTPRNLSSYSTDAEDSAPASDRAIDVASKFGTDLSRYQPPTAIPTDTEIKEKKERRARLAKEENFISLNNSGDEDDEDDDDNTMRDVDGRLILKPKEKYPETRLVADDEDMLEGFDEFTADGKITLSRNTEAEAARRRKAEMASLIADAQGRDSESEEEDESEVERNVAFEAAQTRHGTYASRDTQGEELSRPQTPPKIMPLPVLDNVIEQLRKRLRDVELLRMEKTKEMQGLGVEKIRLGEEEVRVQGALKETGEKYQKLRADLDLKNQPTDQPAIDADNAMLEAPPDDNLLENGWRGSNKPRDGHISTHQI